MENLLQKIGLIAVIYIVFKVLKFIYVNFTDSVKEDLVEKQGFNRIKTYTKNNWIPYFVNNIDKFNITRSGLEFYIRNIWDDDYEYYYLLDDDSRFKIFYENGRYHLTFTGKDGSRSLTIYVAFDLEGAFVVGDRVIEHFKEKDTVTHQDIVDFKKLEEEKYSLKTDYNFDKK